MSSDDESISTISTISNVTESRQSNVHTPGKWEINLIGNFLLNLYHRSILTLNDNWCIKKSEMRKEYLQFVTAEQRQKLKQLNDTDNIGTLLHRCGFLLNTERGSPMYKIKSKSLFEFRNNKVKELDNMKMNSDCINKGMTSDDESSDSILIDLLENKPIEFEEDNLEIDETEPKILLEYQGSTIQRRVNNFCPTNMSCYICQEDYSTMESFEEHVQTHGEDTDFEFLTKMDKFNSPIFTMSYRLCKNSHNFCFEFESNLEDLIVEKIIIVQSSSFFYVHNTRVPYKFPENGVNRFFVDSHLFTRHVEQPIVLICHLEDSKDSRMIEQHHFMRTEEFPKVNFSINPYRLPDKKLFKAKFELADYFPPKEIQDALKDDFYYENLMKTSNEFRDYVRSGKNLQPQTIGASLNILLQIEDMDTIRQYLNLKQQNIKLRSFGDEYSFQLKPQQRAFVENILSAYDEVVLTTRTDIFTNTEEILKLMMQNKSDIKCMKKTYVGLIQAVNTGRICFKCDKKIDMHGSYTVICRPSRLNFRYQYRSLELLPHNMEFLKKFLFPAKITPMPLSTKTLDLYNKNLNPEQLQAVRNIAEGPRNDATYVIFGPPGTGKTTTLVEGILQILKKPNTKILVTASSNSACDEVALRLCKYLNHLDIKRVMVRIYSRSSEVRTDTIDDELLENSNMYNGQFYPDIEILHEYRVVICTLSIVAKLATGKFGRKENGATLYTHLFIDEVAASMEAEALMAITTVLTSNSCLIISGDNKQLGPILQSKRAKELGLDASLMDRLLARDCYRVDVDTGDYDRTIQTRLIRNHRSHPAIVKLYSGLFYNHSLEAVAELSDVSLSENWHKSRNKQYPIIFHAIYEPSKCDNRSHSLYNLKELEVVMEYVKDFMYFGINGEPVNESDIGIISPYKNQYRRIEEELKLRKWFNIETGSVEIFQGKEKNIIIVSFVRSGTENLGFLDCPRRLNVTVSRAKSILILIGNPKTLSSNADFDYIIKECQRNNTFIGSNGPPSRGVGGGGAQEKFTQINEKMQGLSLENINQYDVMKKSQRRRRGRRGGEGRGGRGKNVSSKSNGKSNERNNIDKDNDENEEEDEENEKDENENNCLAKDQEKKCSRRARNRGGNNSRPRKTNNRNENKDENENRGSQDNDNKKPINSALAQKNSNSNKNLKKGNDMQKSRKHVAANDGKISKQHGRERGQKNITDKNKIDAIFNELPQVPKTSSQPNKIYTNNQLFQMQEQQQIYLNLQKNNNNNNNPFFNSPTTTTTTYANRQTGLVHNPYLNQQQQNFNPNYPTMSYIAPNQQSNFINQQQQNFNSQPFNYSNPMMNYNTNLAGFGSFNSTVPNKPNNYAAGSTVTVGAKNISSTKDNLRKNNSIIKNNSCNSTGAIKKPPKTGVSLKETALNTTNNSNGNSSTKTLANSGNIFSKASSTGNTVALDKNNMNNNKVASALNLNMTASTSAKPFAERKLENPERSTTSEFKKPLQPSGSINLVSKASGGNTTTTTTSANWISSTNINNSSSSTNNNLKSVNNANLSGRTNQVSKANGDNTTTTTTSTNWRSINNTNVIRPNSTSTTPNSSSTLKSNSNASASSTTTRSSNFPTTYSNNARLNSNSVNYGYSQNVQRKSQQSDRKDNSCVIS